MYTAHIVISHWRLTLVISSVINHFQDAVDFKAFLTLFKCGNTDPTQAEKHVVNTMNVMKLTASTPFKTSSGHDVSHLLDVKIKNKKWQPNTIKAYLNSLRLYIVYLKHRLESNVAGFESYMPDQLSRILERIKRWYRSFMKKNKKARAENPWTQNIHWIDDVKVVFHDPPYHKNESPHREFCVITAQSSRKERSQKPPHPLHRIGDLL